MNISWENYQVVYVSDFDYKYLPIENFENYVYLTFGS